ncbi:MAG: isocitrate lyase/PEP mutase family protein [Nocardioides sp.]
MDTVPTDIAKRRADFCGLHRGPEAFVIPNAWDIGSARLFTAAGARAIATTSAGFAWTVGKLDQQVGLDELLVHVEALAAAVAVPVSVDAERLFAEDLAGIAETVRLLAAAGAAGCSIEDYHPGVGAIDDLATATERVGAAAEAARSAGVVLTARAERLLYSDGRGSDDLDDVVERLRAYRAVGADVLYAPGLTSADQISAIVKAVDGAPVNVLALPGAPSVPELSRLGVRRVSCGSLAASAAYRAGLDGVRELLGPGTSTYARRVLASADKAAIGPE